MTTKTVQHTAGPMEAIVRRDAYLSEEDGILQAAIASDAIRADLLAALQAMMQHKCVGPGCYNTAHEQADAAITKATAA